MSRGFGKIERAILDVLEKDDRLVDTFTLAAIAFGLAACDGKIVVTDAQLVSVRRALRSLEARGKAFAVMRGHNKRAYWANERLGLWHAVRQGQQRTADLAGDPASLRQHADRLVPLIKRANELGINFNNPVFSQEVA
jgi:hypothetical protein